MKEFALVRIDDRLIHGQVMAVWMRYLGNVKHIVIVDDNTAKDPFMTQVLRAAAPAGVQVSVLSVADAISTLGGEDADFSHHLLLMRSPRTALALLEGGVHFSTLNVGGIGAGPGRKPLYRNISASPQEMEWFRAIQAKGVEISFRIVPDDKGVSFRNLDKSV